MLTKSAVYQKRKQYGHSIKVRIGIVGCLRRGLERPGDAHCPPSTRVTWTQFFFSDWGPLLRVENTSELGRPKWSLCWGFSRCPTGAQGKSAISLLSINSADKLVQAALKFWGFLVTNRHYHQYALFHA